MMRKTIALALACFAGIAFAGAAQAQTVTANNPASIVKVLQEKGYRAELSKDPTGDPMIKSSSSGSNFTILFYGCTDGRACETIQFFAGYSDAANNSVTAMNEWNAKNRFGRAYVTDEGSARVEMDLDLDDGGMSTALFEDNIEFWVTIMASFEDYIVGE